MKVKVGKISFANLFPIFYTLEKDLDPLIFEFIEGVPSVLNKKIRAGEIDISPSSSIEYLRNEDNYLLIENNSISSKGPIGSIFLFSKRPIETLNGSVILTSSQSETSVGLLEVILKKFYRIECTMATSAQTLEDALSVHDAYLLIGDQALTGALKQSRFFVYDLGEIWYRNTGLPSVFALWIVRKNFFSGNSSLMESFSNALNVSKEYARKNFREIAKASPLAGELSTEDLVSYWGGISYDFNEEHKRGLSLFKQYLEELKLL